MVETLTQFTLAKVIERELITRYQTDIDSLQQVLCLLIPTFGRFSGNIYINIIHYFIYRAVKIRVDLKVSGVTSRCLQCVQYELYSMFTRLGHTHLHRHALTQTHALAHTCTHIDIQTCPYTRTHTYALTQAHAVTQTLTQTCTYTCTRAHGWDICLPTGRVARF